MTPADDGTLSWRELLAGAVDALAAAGVGPASSEARRLVAEAAGVELGELGTHLEDPATRGGVARLDAMLRRRADGEPLQYVLGSWGFRHLELMVDRRVLIPRPETEQVVEAALVELDRLGANEVRTRVLDLGTGSGAIALAIATERPRSEVWAVDVDSDAIAVARANLVGVGRAAARVRMLESDWFAGLPSQLVGGFDLIVANPPYVPDDAALPTDVAEHEPSGALFAGPDGTDALQHILTQAPRWMRAGGVLVCELSPEQGPSMVELAERHFVEARLVEDLTGRVRCIVAAGPRPVPPVDTDATG